MDVSIIIVNYNTLHVLRPCLDSIIEQTTGIDYEIIVVDNGSTDGSIEALSNDDRITLIATGENLGFGKANNKGLLYARGEYIFFLNSDTLLVNNAIKQLYDFATHYQGKLGALGCVLEDRKGNKIHSYGSFPKMRDDLQKYIVIPLLKGFCLYRQPATLYPDEWMKVDYITGADLFVSSLVLKECEAFHPAFFLIKAWSAVVVLLLVPVTLNCLGDYKNGIWLTISSLLLWIDNMDIGLGNGLRNKIAEYIAHQETHRARQMISSTFALLSCIIIPVILVLAVLILSCDTYQVFNASPSIVSDLDRVLIITIMLVCTTFVFKLIGNRIQFYKLINGKAKGIWMK